MVNYTMGIGDQLKITRLRGQGMGWEPIAREMGMKSDVLRKIFDPVWAKIRKQNSAQRSAQIREITANKRAAGIGKDLLTERIPAHVLIERDMRENISPRDLTAVLCGDPLPGMSALDRRRAT